VEDFAAFAAEPHPEMTPDAVSMAYLVSGEPSAEKDALNRLAERLRREIPQVCLVGLLLPEPLVEPDLTQPLNPDFNEVARSLEQAAQQAIARFPQGRADAS
jgi:hypothetical protein